MKSKALIVHTNQRQIILTKSQELPIINLDEFPSYKRLCEKTVLISYDDIKKLNMNLLSSCYAHTFSKDKNDFNDNIKKLIMKALASMFDYVWHPQSKINKPLILYPGSFNPFHLGHATCLNLVSRWGEPIIMPDINPNKSVKSEPWDITVSLLKYTKNLVDPKFLIANKKNPTAHWVRQLKVLHPQLHLSLLMGFDSFASMESWIEAELLLKSLDRIFIAARQESHHQYLEVKNRIQSKYPQLTNEHLGHHLFEHLASSNF